MADGLRYPRPTGIDRRPLPLRLADAKAQSRIEHDDDDQLIVDFIRSAVQLIEEETGYILLAREYRVDMPAFPGTAGLRIAMKPVTAVVSVTYMDSDGIEQTLDPSVYRLDQYGLYPTINLAYEQSWPATQSREDAVRVTFTAGVQQAEHIEPIAQQLLRLIVADWYENRESLSPLQLREIPLGAERLLGRLRVY